MNQIPVYWKTRLDQVEETLAHVKKGRVTKPAVSAGGRPIYMIEYGKSNLPPRKANLSSALGGKDFSSYADKSGVDYVPKNRTPDPVTNSAAPTTQKEKEAD